MGNQAPEEDQKGSKGRTGKVAELGGHGVRLGRLRGSAREVRGGPIGVGKGE